MVRSRIACAGTLPPCAAAGVSRISTAGPRRILAGGPPLLRWSTLSAEGCPWSRPPQLCLTTVGRRGVATTPEHIRSPLRYHFNPPTGLVRTLHSVTSPWCSAVTPFKWRQGHLQRHTFSQKRTLFVATERTPNEDSIKFKPETPVLPEGVPTLEYLSYNATASSPLARSLFRIEGVRGVMYGRDFITVTKDPDVPWQLVKPDVLNAIMDHLSTGEPVISLDAQGNPMYPKSQNDTVVHPDDLETVAMIKELLETRVRPAIQEDGGDIEYRGFENGVVKLRMRGACRTCDSAVVTLKNGIENMLMHYIPEVSAVEQVYDDEEAAGIEEFKKLEERLAQKHSNDH